MTQTEPFWWQLLKSELCCTLHVIVMMQLKTRAKITIHTKFIAEFSLKRLIKTELNRECFEISGLGVSMFYFYTTALYQHFYWLRPRWINLYCNSPFMSLCWICSLNFFHPFIFFYRAAKTFGEIHPEVHHKATQINMGKGPCMLTHILKN